MPHHNHPRRIVMAEDDEDDQVLVRDALRDSKMATPVDFVADGEALLAYLRQHRDAPPALVVLDLNMPRMNGHEALQAIRADVALRHIPVVVFTTSGRAEDILRSYQLGANAYVTKPATYPELVETLRLTLGYWLGVVKLPSTS
jgi:two-component system response regulator